MKLVKLTLVLVTVGSACAQEPSYGGPAILSRGQIAGGQQRSSLFNIRPFVSVSGMYDNGLTGTAVDPQGHLLDAASYGVDGRAGVAGYHAWKRSMLGLDYSIDAHHYTAQSNYDGIDQSLSLNYNRRLTRRLDFSIQESAGITNRSGMLGDTLMVDPGLVTIPTDEIFTSRVYYQSTYSTVSFQKSMRWSFSAGGNNFVAKRHSPILVSGHGYGAYGDTSYRLNKTTSLTFFYRFGHFAHAQSFGAADFHIAGMGYAKDFGRQWHFSLSGGVIRMELLGLTLVPIDPVIAAIIGQTSGVQVAYHLNYLPNVQANLARTFHRSMFQLAYNEGVNPGNGVYLTSRHRAGSAGYNYSGGRNWGFGAGMGYTRYTDLSRAIGAYESFGGSVNASYRVVRSVFFSVNGEVRDATAARDYTRRYYRATAGFTWSPGDYPISFR